MKYIIKTINISLFSLVILLSGCNVADNINKEILDIEDSDSQTNVNPPDGDNQNPPDDNDSDPINVDTNLSQGEENVTGDGGTDGTNQEPSDNTTDPQQCPTGYHIDGEQCIPDQTGGSEYIDVEEFNLTLPDFNNQKSATIVMGKNEEKSITIRSNPKQTDINTKLSLIQYTNNSVVSSALIFEGAPIVSQNYDYGFKLISSSLTGKDEFQLTLENDNGFTDSVYINVEVVDQIMISGVREKYTLVTDGDEQNITITGYNTLGNPLEFEIVNQAVINEEMKLALIVQGSKIFNTNTASGVDFKFSARGLEDEKREVEIRVKDRSTGTVESIFVTIESVKRNTVFYVDLYECNEEYNKNYDVTSDENTPLSPDGVYSADNAIYLKSTHEMDYDIGNRFSTVMVFHPTTGQQYSYDTYGKEYIRNIDTGKSVATIYYATSLQGVRYYVKYYNEDKNSIVCEKRNFPYLDTVSDETIGSWEEQYSTPEVDLESSSGVDGSIPTIF